MDKWTPPTEADHAAALTAEILNLAGLDWHGELALGDLELALGAVAQMCDAAGDRGEVDMTLFSALMRMAREQAGRAALHQRLRPHHRDALAAALTEAGLGIVREEARPRAA